MPRLKYSHETLRMPELADAVEGPDVIDGYTFVECELIGPAVLALLGGVTIAHSTFEAHPDELFLELGEPRMLYGVIGLLNCEFTRCKFARIGFVGSAETIEAFRQSVSPE